MASTQTRARTQLFENFYPKHLYSRLGEVKITAYLAVEIFNQDYTAIFCIMEYLKIQIVQQATRVPKRRDVNL